MSSYVCGFMCSWDLQNFLLIRKTHPEWQKGKLNGIGGKIESGCKNLVTGEFYKMAPGEYMKIYGELHMNVWSSHQETPHEAMIREFYEETGILTKRERWHCFHVEDFITGPDSQIGTKIYYFAAFGDDAKRQYIGENKDPLFEVVSSYTLVDLLFYPGESTIYNIGYLLSMIIENVRNGSFKMLNPQGVNTLSLNPPERP